MKLTRNGQIVLLSAFVVALLMSGVGFVKAKTAEAKYQEQSAQMQLYKDELNDAQNQINEYIQYKAMYECIQVEKNQLQEQVDEMNK